VSDLIGAKPDYAGGWVFPSIALEIASPTNEFMLTPLFRASTATRLWSSGLTRTINLPEQIARAPGLKAVLSGHSLND